MLPALKASPLLLSCLSLGAHAALNGHCPPLGPVLPAPTNPGKHEAVPAAAAALRDILSQMTASYNGSAVAIGVKSIHETDLLFEYTYTPPNKDKRGVQEVDLDTVFRLGSLTKVFTPLALLKLKDRGVSLDDPITKYVPELRALKDQAREDSPVWAVEWDEVTLGSLASHMAGIPSDRECNGGVSPGLWLTTDSNHGYCTVWQFLGVRISTGKQVQVAWLCRLLWDCSV
jgi:CubicO group peptidase (beta-lactamase class C family)